jgi:hypothetical protein
MFSEPGMIIGAIEQQSADAGLSVDQWALVVAILALALSLFNFLWEWITRLWPRVTVVLDTDVEGKKELVGLIANTGFRAFTVRNVALRGTFGESGDYDRVDLLGAVTVKQQLLAPGEVLRLEFADVSWWWTATHLEVETLPGILGSKRYPLPHTRRQAKAWHRYVLKCLRRGLSDYEVEDQGIQVFVGRCGVGVEVSTVLMLDSPEDQVGSSTVSEDGDSTVANEVVNTLHSRLPHLFARAHDSVGRAHCYWSPAVRRLIRAGRNPIAVRWKRNR